jgi:NAD(P)-dependent dehydrogenase (short-subunit alcohol dehydrogenase family)
LRCDARILVSAGTERAFPSARVEFEWCTAERTDRLVELMTERSDGKVALVTGAASGLGAATVRVLSDAGYCVAALDRVPVADVEHDAIRAFVCDVTDAAAIGTAVTDIVDRFGRIDVAVNCAGIDHTYWLEQLTVAQFDEILAVNLRGPFLIAKAVWPEMKRQGGGHIVNVASTAAVRVWSGASAYHASKSGLLGLGRGLSLEGRPDNVRVTTIIPGGMRTGFFERFADQGIPAPDPTTLQDPADVARTILFAITSPAGSVVQELVVTPPDEPSWP